MLASGNAPHSAASTSRLAAAGVARKFEQELARMVAEVGREDLTPAMFRGLVGELRGALAAIGRETIEQVLQAKDEVRSSVDVGGERARYRGMAEAEWLTPFGKVAVLRRTYRADGPGKPSAVPLDDACGMRGRFMTAEVEEMAALGMAMLTAPEVAKMLGKALPEGPSATAIQNAVHQRGEEIATHRAAIEAAIDEQAPLSSNGDILVVSYDRVMARRARAAPAGSCSAKARSGSARWRPSGSCATCTRNARPRTTVGEDGWRFVRQRRIAA